VDSIVRGGNKLGKEAYKLRFSQNMHVTIPNILGCVSEDKVFCKILNKEPFSYQFVLVLIL
jgi:hypothetical protein